MFLKVLGLRLLTLFLLLVLAQLLPAAPLLIGGTGAALGTIQALADEYHKENPEVTIKVLSSMGSGGGIRALAKGRIDIALIGRPFKKKEQLLGLQNILYARTPLVFAVHKNSPIDSISLKEVISFYTGENFYWPHGERCRPILRPKHDSETISLKKLLPDLAPALDKVLGTKGTNISRTAQENANAINKIPGSFGYSTLALILSEKRPLKILRFNEVEPTISNLKNAAYPLYKELRLVIQPGKQAQRDQFIAFIFSKKGQNILNKFGNQGISY